MRGLPVPVLPPPEMEEGDVILKCIPLMQLLPVPYLSVVGIWHYMKQNLPTHQNPRYFWVPLWPSGLRFRFDLVAPRFEARALQTSFGYKHLHLCAANTQK